jgi:uncharacterized membrane protein SpoIIM required for sporulation
VVSGEIVTEEQFRTLRQPRWKAFEETLTDGKKRAARAADFPREYSRLCRDLSLAQARRYSPILVQDLNRLVWEGHQHLYHRPRASLAGVLAALTTVFPRAVRAHARLFWWCHLLCYGAAALAWFYAQSSAEHAHALLGSAVYEYKQMYDPSAAHFLKPRGVQADADMFGFYVGNNMTIGLRTFASGAVAGVGSLVFLVLNGLLLGGVAGVVAQAGFSSTFFPYVVGHGAFELTAILLYAVAGFRLGGTLLRPGTLSRGEAMRRTGLEVLPLVIGSTVFLFIAACIEAFWSSLVIDAVWKYIVGAVLWPLVYGFLWFGGRRER